MEPLEWLHPLGQTDFYREHQGMQRARSHHTSDGLLRHLRELYGDQEALALGKLQPQALMLAGSRARRMLRESDLLLIKFEVLEAAENALRQLVKAEDNEFDFAPLPDNTVFGFELPMEFRVPRAWHKNPCRRCRERGHCPGTLFTLMSVVAPCPFNVLLPGARNDQPVFIGYSRLADQIRAFEFDPRPHDGRAVEHLRRFEQEGVHWQVCAWEPMDEPLDGNGISMRQLLQASLALGSQPRPYPVARSGAGGGSGAHSAPQVQTVELARSPRKPVQHPGTGKPLEYQSTTKGHWRRYRDADGNLIKEKWIEGYTRAGDKPKRPPEAQRGRVRVARLPQPPTETK